MTDYSKMSDGEINQSITCIQNPDAQKMMLIGDGSCFYDCGPDGNGFYEVPIPDYCDSWADAGPIIEHNGISLVRSGTGMWWADGNAYWVDGVEWQIDGEGDNNPLRAAMIVFLMMKDAENANPS